jgi:hypothetical protein
MSRKTWIGNAAAVKQISTITVGGTWLSTETATLTINTKDLVLTLVGDEATTAVATALKEMWMAASRLDGTGTTDATSNAGGQQFGEFSEVTATVSGSVVTLTANRPGVPFVVTVGETSTSGTLTLATPQAATGPNFWNNTDNWDTTTVPVDDDVVVLKDSNVSILYGLPNGSLEVTFEHWMSYVGEVGLYVINTTDPAKQYYEYRQRYVRLDDSGTGTNIAHSWGMGEGFGSPLINVRHTAVKNSHVVYNTGRPHPSRVGTKSLNICSTVNTSTLNILNGSVEWGAQDGQTSAFVAVAQTAGDSRGVNGLHTTGVVKCNGGQMLIGGTPTIFSVDVRGGVLRMEGQTGTISTLTTHKSATTIYASTATITSNFVIGTFDARPSLDAFTVTNGSVVYIGGTYLDPYQRSSSEVLLACEPTECTVLLGGGPGNTLTIAP